MRPFWDTADLFRQRTDITRFAFTEPGRPVFWARGNQFPHQMTFSLNGLPLTNPLNGLVNLGHITPDYVASAYIDRASDSTRGDEDLALFSRYRNSEEPYSRLNYYEGDFNLSNFNAYFSRRYGSRLNIQLAGQNSAYDGWAPGMFSDRFSYHARMDAFIDSSSTLTFFYNFSKNNARMANFGEWSDYSFKTYYARYHWRYTRTGAGGFTLDAAWMPQGASLASSRDSFATRHYNERFYTRLSKALQAGPHHICAQLALDNVTYSLNDARRSFYNQADLTFSHAWSLGDHWRWQNRISGSMRERSPLALQAESGIDMRGGKIDAGLKLTHRERLPLPVEIDSPEQDNPTENHDGVTLHATYQPLTGFRLFIHGSAWRATHTIRFDGARFYREDKRTGQEARLGFQWTGQRIELSGAYRHQWTTLHIAPRDRATARITYRDAWFNDRMFVYFTVGWQAWQTHNILRFNPQTVRFYAIDTMDNNPVQILWFKGVIRVSDIEFYMTADNLLSTDYSYIDGYPEQLRRLRFGLNWEIFN